MESALTLGSISSSPSILNLRPQSLSLSPTLHFSPPYKPPHGHLLQINAMSSSKNPPNSITHTLKTVATAVVFATVAIGGRFHSLTARAEPPVIATEEKISAAGDTSAPVSPSPLTQFLESNTEGIDTLKSLLQQKMELGEDEEALKIVNKLVLAQPEAKEWNFLKARLLSEMGRTQEARQVFEEILERDPLSFEALFENALLMDRCGESEAVIGRLEEALKLAEESEKMKEARDVKLIMAQVEFLHKNVDGALKSYEELISEDPTDFRPYFCKGMIYSLLGKNKEAREEFAKYKELSPKKFEVEGYLRTPLSKMKLFGTDEDN